MKTWRIYWHDYVTPTRVNLCVVKCPTLAEALDRVARDLAHNSGLRLNAWCPVKVVESDDTNPPRSADDSQIADLH